MTMPADRAQPVCFSFGDNPELADRLLALVLAGKKDATCGALAHFGGGGEPLPQVGRRDIVLNGAGEEACVIETVSVEIMPFDAIPPTFTDREGEGPYAEWRAGHEAYFARNGGFSPDMEIVCEIFRLVEVLPAGRQLLAETLLASADGTF
ncbi:ASCH domain-containing protein [Devosia sp. Leaf64]|uniref:ASCH domain-containing protein n=1 Tax=Devosia sp. Leaf64 TaxID=1736229 RepID=UPI0007125BD4|nr:ASCH domain-containing protein [Devosia sp. Leaf64]KQN78113.1 ASCH domain-containing protein [Devosia sp. Leaf64]